MTDRELLEMAAKAAGIEHDGEAGPWLAGQGNCALILRGTDEVWSPLTDDGDALRLAVKLGLGLMFIPTNERGDEPFVNATLVVGERLIDCHEEYGADARAATRRAIVRAAASLTSEGKDRG